MLPDGHRAATLVAVEMRCLQLVELFVHGTHRNDPPDYGPPDTGCQGWAGVRHLLAVQRGQGIRKVQKVETVQHVQGVRAAARSAMGTL